MKLRIQIVAVLLALACSAQASETARHSILGRMFTTNDYFGAPGETADPFTCNGPTERSVYYNTTSHLLYVCNGSAWVSAGAGSFVSPVAGNYVLTGKWTFGSAADAAGSVRLGETASCIVFEGATADGFETKICVTDPTAALIFNTPNASAGTYSFLTTAAAVAVGQGGTGIASGTSGGIPYFSSTTTIASSGLLTLHALLVGGGSGATPTVVGSLGTSTTLLHGAAAGDPTFASVVSADLNITTTSCTNQFITAISAAGVGTCTTDTLASAQHANQGTTTTVLHGNGAGNPAFGSVTSSDVSGTTGSGNFVLATTPVLVAPAVTGASDVVQLTVTGNGTQTSNLVNFTDSTPTTVFDVNVNGAGNGSVYVNKTNSGDATATGRFFGVIGTMPTTLTQNTAGVVTTITGAGSSSFLLGASNLTLAAGYTGSSLTIGHSVVNSSAGTGTSFLTSAGGNEAIRAVDNATTVGTNVGVLGNASNGNEAIGIVGLTSTTKNSGINIGVAGFSANGGTSPTRVGVFGGLMSTEPTYTDAAGLFDNGAIAAPILVARDNGTAVFTIGDGGDIQIARTITAGGTTGAQTINKLSGTVNFAAAATALTVTNSFVTTSSIVFCVIRTNDTTATIKNVVPGTGSFVITLTAGATAETSVGFLVTD